MAMTNNEKQEAYREKMYAEGYKQARIWIPRDSEGKDIKLQRKDFLRRIEALTYGMSKAKLSKIFSETLKIIKSKIEGGA